MLSPVALAWLGATSLFGLMFPGSTGGTGKGRGNKRDEGWTVVDQAAGRQRTQGMSEDRA